MPKKFRLIVWTAVFFCVIFLLYISSDVAPEISDTTSQLDINFPRPEETLLEPVKFSSWDETNSYVPTGPTSSHLHTVHEAQMIENARTVADNHVGHQGVFQSGRHRLLPEGIEYDLNYLNENQMTRVTLFQPLETPKLVHMSSYQMNKIVNIIMPLKGRVSAMETFLDHLIQNIIPHDQNIALTVVYFRDHELPVIQQMMDSKLGGFDGFKWSLMPVNNTRFSRGLGLQIGVKNATSHPDDLVFFCDVDILMKPDFFTRCRANAVLGHQVYYPIVFSLYNPSLVYPLMDREVPPVLEQLVVDSDNGFWRDFGFGMACVYRGDLDYQGGLLDLKGWGGEDVSLYENFLKYKPIKVNRAPDRSLFHIYHSKQCTNVQDISYPSCLKSKALTEGSQLQLGMMLIKLHDGVDLEGILSKRYYYFWLVPFFSILLFLSLLFNIFLAVVIFRYFIYRKYIPN